MWFQGKPIGEGVKTYKDGSMKRGRWIDGVFEVTEVVEEHEKRDTSEQSKPIDVTKFSRPQQNLKEMKMMELMPLEEQKKISTMMQIYIDEEGYVTFPDGSRYKGSLYGGIPEGEGRIIYTDGSIYDGEWRAGNAHG
mmetsp:Transcript_1998/g.2748  ORF Transcript_1998/g.2748 Transcript_1998/m.2748 type:complete len:137 (+) Transcript_1998:736-1146(+)